MNLWVGWGKGVWGSVPGAAVSDKREVAVKRLLSAGQSARFVRKQKYFKGSPSEFGDYVDFVEVRLRADEREYYLILEYLEGMPGASLRERIKHSESGLEVTEALRLFMGIWIAWSICTTTGLSIVTSSPANLYAPSTIRKSQDL